MGEAKRKRDAMRRETTKSNEPTQPRYKRVFSAIFPEMIPRLTALAVAFWSAAVAMYLVLYTNLSHKVLVLGGIGATDVLKIIVIAVMATFISFAVIALSARMLPSNLADKSEDGGK
jgi:hypothetical protein